MITLIFVVLVPVFLIFLFLRKGKGEKVRLPGPKGLPIIGNLHQLDSTHLHSQLCELSKKYGPLVFIRLGSVQTLVVSSARTAKEVLKTHDLIFCNRPLLYGSQKYSYKGLDVSFSPYNDRWKEVKKIVTLQLLSSKRTQSFRQIRENEMSLMIKKIGEHSSINLSKMVTTLTCTIICRIAFNKRLDTGSDAHRFHTLLNECQAGLARFYMSDYFPFMSWLDYLSGSRFRLQSNWKQMDSFYQEVIDEHLNPQCRNSEDLVDYLLKLKNDKSTSFEITFDHIKATIMNVLVSGTDTSATAVVWAMTELMRNPRVMKKAQEEIRSTININKKLVDEDDMQKLKYLKAIVKESMRLHPPVPLLVPRESMEKCTIDGYVIQAKTLVYVNVYAIGRDPESWENPDTFLPERFLDSDIDFKGQDFELIPFGSGRRKCPAIVMGALTVELILSNLIYSFDWELPEGMNDTDLDFDPVLGIVVAKKNDLLLIPHKTM